MGRIQSNLVLFFLGFFLLAVAVFRHEWFYHTDALPYLLMVLLLAGFILIAVGLFRLLTGKGRHGILVLLVLEVLLMGTFKAMSVSQTSRVPQKVKEYFAGVYMNGFMNCIQYDRAASQFDGQLQYILKLGTHEFKNLEFSTSVEVNRQGLRDSERNLRSPEVVFLGDSYTMGWGVNGQDCFVRQFEAATGKKCLNAGISSYGTAREYLLLKRLSLDSCQLLMIQYNDNDLLENFMFFHNGERLAEEQEFFKGYNKSVRINLLVKNYYPFKYLYWMIRNSSANLKFLEKAPPGPAHSGGTEAFPTDHGPYLTKVLEAVRGHYKGPIVFFYLGKPILPDVNAQLVRVLEENKALGIQWLDMQEARFGERDFFTFDMHLNERGHQKVARQLEAFIVNAHLFAKDGR